MCDAIIAVLYDSDLFALGITMEDVEDVLRDTCEDWAIGPVHCQGAYYPAHRHVYASKMPNCDATNYLFSLPFKHVMPMEHNDVTKNYVLAAEGNLRCYLDYKGVTTLQDEDMEALRQLREGVNA